MVLDFHPTDIFGTLAACSVLKAVYFHSWYLLYLCVSCVYLFFMCSRGGKEATPSAKKHSMCFNKK